ncbi:MAG: hypothetical protein ABIV13_05500 [Fimbriimonadales bacterium]
MLLPLPFLASLVLAQGHTVEYKRVADLVKYDFRGQMLTTYAGAIDAPPTRQVDINGTLVLKTEARPGGRWVVVTNFSGLKATRSGKAIPAAESKLAFKGIWTQTLGAGASYTADGKAILPVAVTAPLWPISWMPIAAGKGMTVGESWDAVFTVPAQAFLEDDPVGWFPVSLSFVFNGQDPFDKTLYGFALKSNRSIDEPVKHPEAADLRLVGNVLVDGRLKTRKDDGRLQSANVIMSYDLMLTNDEYPFGFSKARASVTAVLERLQ